MAAALSVFHHFHSRSSRGILPPNNARLCCTLDTSYPLPCYCEFNTMFLLCNSDSDGHYLWPGRIYIMNDSGLIRSMLKKGCSPDNSACEGFFGRLKNEMFYGRSWNGISIEEFIAIRNDYIHWYNEFRIKESLGWRSPWNIDAA